MQARTKHYWLAAALMASGLALGACATEEYVDQSVAAHAAQNDATAAAEQARTEEVAAAARAAMARAQDAHKLAEGNFQHSVLMTDDSVRFASGKAALSADAQTSLTAFAQKIIAVNKDVYIEIQGHGDARGSKSFNMKLGAARADAVMRFLHDQGIPLYHMSTISYGEERPAAPNTTAAGMAENRRVVLIVMN